MSKSNTNHLATYHLHYKDIVGNPTRTFIYTANCLYFLCYWNNLLAVFFLTHDCSACTTKPGLVIKKGELPKTLLIYIIDI